jgi:hypothetical protein
MEKLLLCPMTVVCAVYNMYVELTGDDMLGVIHVSRVEGGDYLGCKALNTIQKFGEEGKLPEEFAGRMENLSGCYLIYQVNKQVVRRRQDS